MSQLRMRLFLVPSMPLLLRQTVHLKITLRRNPESVGNSIEERKHGSDVHRLGDLRFRPTMIPKPLHILVRRAIGCFCHLGYVIKQCPFCRGQARFFQIALRYRLYRALFGSLNTQEVCMRVQSIRTAIEP